MRRPAPTTDVLRPMAGLVLLAAFLGAAQLAPVAHLANHRNDHTHGPEVPVGAPPDARAHRHDGHPADHVHKADAGAGVDHNHPPAEPSSPTRDHGHGSSAHFGLALIEGPPPAFLPPPGQTRARPADAAVHRHHAPAPSQPGARGPPA